MKVLIIDDYLPGADSLRGLLEIYGAEADIAVSYADGLAAWSPEYDLVVSDRDLGDGNGIDLLAALRERGLTSKTALMSGGLSYGEAADLQAAGVADLVLVKGVETGRQLLELVKDIAGDRGPLD